MRRKQLREATARSADLSPGGARGRDAPSWYGRAREVRGTASRDANSHAKRRREAPILSSGGGQGGGTPPSWYGREREVRGTASRDANSHAKRRREAPILSSGGGQGGGTPPSWYGREREVRGTAYRGTEESKPFSSAEESVLSVKGLESGRTATADF